MALELNVSKIKNTVTFAVDKVSMKAAKDSIKELEKFATNIEPAFKVDKAKKQLDDIRKEYEKLQKEVNKPLSPKVVPPKNSPNTSPTGSTNKPSGGSSGNGDAEERRRQARIDTANVARSRFQFQSGRFRNVGQEDIDSAALRANEVTRAFEAGEVSARRMNSVLTQELTKLRDIGKENTNQANANYKMARWRMSELVREGRERERQAKREEVALERQRRIVERTAERRKERLTDAAMSLNPRMLMGGLGIAAAVEGVSRIVEGLRSTAERVNLTASGARNVQTNPNAIAAITAYGQANGIDSASIKKITDNIKDVRERIASSVMQATLNKKGQYTGGDSGVDQVMNTFGWNPAQIKRFQSDPLNFLQAIENEGQRRGMNPAQIGHLMENLGDDLMHYEPAFRDGGAEILKFAQMINDAGASINDSTENAAKSFQVLSVKLDLIEQGIGNNFLVGFMDGLKTDSTSFANNVKMIDKAAMWLGGEIADLANQFATLLTSVKNAVDWYDKTFHTPTKDEKDAASSALSINPPIYTNPDAPWDHSDPNATSLASNASDSLWSGLSSWWNRVSNSTPTLMGLQYNPPTANSMISQNSQGVYPPVNANLVIPDSAIQVNVIPDGLGFSNYLSAQVGQGLTTQFNQLTLDTLSSTATRN